MNYDSKIIMPDTLCRGRFDLITQFHDCLASNQFCSSDSFIEDFFPFLTICQPTPNYHIAPPIRLIGKRSEQRKLFKLHCGADLAADTATPDENLERLSAYGYEYAFENGMFCQECETTIDTANGPLYVPFIRYIAKYKDRGGASLIAYLSMHLNPTLQ